jgi:hypothetical protein
MWVSYLIIANINKGWSIDRFQVRFSEDFGRRVYRKTNVVSENKNENAEITIKEADVLRKQILAKFDRF